MQDQAPGAIRDPLNTGEGKGHPQTNTLGEQNIRDDEISEETHEEDGTHDEYDQESSISFDDDDEDSTASQEDNLEDWIEHGKRSTEEADEQMLTYNIPNWIETQRKLKWRQALRISRQMDQKSRQVESGTHHLDKRLNG